MNKWKASFFPVAFKLPQLWCNSTFRLWFWLHFVFNLNTRFLDNRLLSLLFGWSWLLTNILKTRKAQWKFILVHTSPSLGHIFCATVTNIPQYLMHLMALDYWLLLLPVKKFGESIKRIILNEESQPIPLYMYDKCSPQHHHLHLLLLHCQYLPPQILFHHGQVHLQFPSPAPEIIGKI